VNRVKAQSSSFITWLLLGFLAGGGASGCALFTDNAVPKVTGPIERVFRGSQEDVWRAVMLALQSPKAYPLRLSDMDSGTIETEPIKGPSGWQSPFSSEPLSSGYSYRLLIQVIKGEVQGRVVHKVSIRKMAQIQRDFVAEPESIPSDGYEEQAILYRIGREITIDRAIRRAHTRESTKR